ncbi:hypothetical protein AB0B15_14190 [Streptomyces sp. NPDC045456]|uniref:hypothetical protein n=1 Tax=Streptomyces sp. NPDC045456 TaxID=3155254 RepID=UPI00340A814F
MNDPWPHLLAHKVQTCIDSLAPEVREHVRETVRDILDIAGRNPWGWPQWDDTDPEGEDIRCASVGKVVLVYSINRARRHLYGFKLTYLP